MQIHLGKSKKGSNRMARSYQPLLNWVCPKNGVQKLILELEIRP